MSEGAPSRSGWGILEQRAIAGLHEHLVDQLPRLSGDAPILDLGCGTGAWLARLAGLGHRELWGVDRQLDDTRPPIARWHQADLDSPEWGLPRRDFELVTAIEVVEHLTNHGFFYANVAAHLRSGAHFLMTTPNIHSTPARLRFLVKGTLGQFDEKGDPTHLQPILLSGLSRTLPRCGMEIVRTWGYPGSGSLTFRRSISAFARLLSALMPEILPGDVMCVLTRKE